MLADVMVYSQNLLDKLELDTDKAGKMQTVLHLKILKVMKQNEANVIVNQMRIRR